MPAKQVIKQTAGAQIYIKYENQNPTGSFKIRGGASTIMAAINLSSH